MEELVSINRVARIFGWSPSRIKEMVLFGINFGNVKVINGVWYFDKQSIDADVAELQAIYPQFGKSESK